MQRKQTQLQVQQAAEQEQKLKLKLARRVLGTSFKRLCSQQAVALPCSLEAGGGGTSDSDVGPGPSPGPAAENGSTVRQVEPSDSHSQVPKLPPLTDACDATGAADGPPECLPGVSVDAAVAGRDPGEGAAGGIHARSASHPALSSRTNAINALRQRPHQYQLSRSVSASRMGVLCARPCYTDSASFTTAGGGGGGGGANHNRSPMPQQPAAQQLRTRRRRSTFPDPRSGPARKGARGGDDGGDNGSGGGDEDDGTDIALSDRHPFRRDTAFLRQQPQPHATQPQAPALAVATRSTSRLTATSGLPPTPSGFALWRARARLPEGQRTFCISGSGNHSQGIRGGLLARGWYENPDRNSPFFDFKWAANPLDINHDTLWPGQIVNHFRHSTCLTTKHGLCYTVRDTAWYEAADAAAFYPRAYDITDETFRKEFLRDVRWTAAESLIKRALIDGVICTTPQSPRRKPSNRNPHAQIHQQQQQQQHGKVSPSPPRATDVSGGDRSGGGGGGSTLERGGDAPSPGGPHGGGDFGVASGEGEEAGRGAGSEVRRLRQRGDSTPWVDMPSLRLACRVVAARLRHQRHLRVVHGGGGGVRNGGGSRRDPDEPPADVELSGAQWQQLVKHRALSCSAPVLPPPEFHPAWLTSRTFITSAMLPEPAALSPSFENAAQAGKGSGGGSGGGSRKGQGPARAARGPPGRRRIGGGGGGSGGTGTDGGDSGSDGEDGGESEGSDDARPAGSAWDLAPAEAGVAAAAEADARPAAAAADTAGASAKVVRPVAVVDAAELLREVYGKAQRRHSAPLPRRREVSTTSASVSSMPEGGNSDELGAGDLQAALSSPLASAAAPAQLASAPATAAGSTEADPGGDVSAADCGRVNDGGTSANADADATAVEASWLPQDLPAICYDDEALQALDHNTWRAAAEAILGALEGSAVQTHISGTNNIWIVKPAGKSRGRGIRLFNDPDALLSYVRGEEAQGLESRWIAQKYVERPLIISRRKFDIRQWVLVTDWNPLQAWFYSTCYLRFAADDYDPNNLDVFQHLTNNSVSKYYEGPKKEDEITASGNMWSVPRFQQWLAEVYGRDDIWEALVQPAMRHIAICTLKSAQDHITPRKGSCQLYGYDFLIDDQLRVWLLEVNSSPTLEPSTSITAQLCADVQEDILKVVIDLPELQAARRQARGGGSGGEAAAAGGGDLGTGPAPSGPAAGSLDTGKWECIINGGEELRQPQYTGLNLELKGTAIHPPPARSNFAGRLYAATRQQQPHQQPPQQQQQSTAAALEDVPSASSSGVGGSSSGDSSAESVAAGGGRHCGQGLGQGVTAASNGSASTPPPSRGAAPFSLSSCTAPQGDRDLMGERQQLLSQQQQHHHHSTQQYLAPPHGADGGAGGGEYELSGGIIGSALMARVTTSHTPPSSRGVRAVSPVRCRTPRISASPVLLTHWDSGGFVLGSFGDLAGAITSFGGGGGGASGPVHPSSRMATPRNDFVMGATPAPITIPASALWAPLSPSPSVDSLTPTTVRMSLLARPGHQQTPSGLAPSGVRAR